MLPGRTDNAIKNHWNSALRRELRKLNRQNSAIIPALADGVDAAGRVEHVAAKLRQQQKGARARGPSKGACDFPGLPGLIPLPQGLGGGTSAASDARRAILGDATAAAAAVMNDGLDAAQDAAVAAIVSAAVAASAQLAAAGGSLPAGMNNTASMVLSALGGSAAAHANAAAAAAARANAEAGEEGDEDDIDAPAEGALPGDLPGEAVEERADAAATAVNSHLLMANVSNLNSLWQNAAEPPTNADVDSISAQVSWLQEFCDHLVENSLSRSLDRANAKERAKEEKAEKRKRQQAEAGARKKAKKAESDAKKAESDDDSEVYGAADSVELCGAFAQAEGGPPTPVDEPLPLALREAIMQTAPGDHSSRRQIRGMIELLRREGRLSHDDETLLSHSPLLPPTRSDSRLAGSAAEAEAMDVEEMVGRAVCTPSSSAAREAMPPPSGMHSAASAVSASATVCSGDGGASIGDGGASIGDVPCTPLSPSGAFAFDVEDLLKIVSIARQRASGKPDVHEVLNSPRGCPLINCASPPTRGPLEALWMIDPVMRPASAEATRGNASGDDVDSDDDYLGDEEAAWWPDGSESADYLVVGVRLGGGGVLRRTAKDPINKKKGGHAARKGAASAKPSEVAPVAKSRSGARRSSCGSVGSVPVTKPPLPDLGCDVSAGASVGSFGAELVRAGSLHPPVTANCAGSCDASTSSSNSPQPGNLSRSHSLPHTPPPLLPDASPHKLPGLPDLSPQPHIPSIPIPYADSHVAIATGHITRAESLEGTITAVASPLMAGGSGGAFADDPDGIGGSGGHVRSPGLSPNSNRRVQWRPKAAEGLRLSRVCLDGADEGGAVAKLPPAGDGGGMPSADSMGLSAHPYHGLGSAGLGSTGLGSNVLLGSALLSAGHGPPSALPPLQSASAMMPSSSVPGSEGDLYALPHALAPAALPRPPLCRAPLHPSPIRLTRLCPISLSSPSHLPRISLASPSHLPLISLSHLPLISLSHLPLISLSSPSHLPLRSSFMNGWVDVDGFSSPAALAAGMSARSGGGSARHQPPSASCRAEAGGPSPPLPFLEGELSPTLLSSPRRSSRMTARTTSC